MTAISNYVAQNFGAGRWDRIRQGVRACLIQTEAFNLIMCIGILLLRHPIVRMFLSDPTKEIYHYSDMYLTIVTPFYFVLGLLAVYRTSIQSMQNGKAPFAACMIELVMRIAATVGLMLRFVRGVDYTDVLLSSRCHSFSVFYGGKVKSYNFSPAAEIIDVMVDSFRPKTVPFVSPAMLRQLLPYRCCTDAVAERYGCQAERSDTQLGYAVRAGKTCGTEEERLE